MSMKLKLRDNKIVILLIGIYIVLTSGHMLQSVYGVTLQWFTMVLAAVMLLPFVLDFRSRGLKADAWAMLLLLLTTALGMLAHFEGIKYYLVLLSNALVAYYIARVFPFEKFVKYYLNVLTVATVIAILGYYLLNYTALLNGLPRMVNVNDVQYGVGYIYNYIVDITERNCGMFWEPGLFATALVIAMVFELLYKQGKTSMWRMALFVWGIITANSSAGFFLTFLCLMLWVVKGREGRHNNVLFTILYAIVFVMGVVVILNLDSIIMSTPLRNNEYFVKLLSDNIQQSSRSEAFVHNLKVFGGAPILGVGPEQAAQLATRVSDTSTSTNLLAIFGILGASYTLFWIWGVAHQKHINVFSKLILIAIFLSIVNKEPHQFMQLSWCVMFYFLANAQYKQQTALESAAEKNKGLDL